MLFNRLIIETRPTADLELSQRFSQGEQIDFTDNRVEIALFPIHHSSINLIDILNLMLGMNSSN